MVGWCGLALLGLMAWGWLAGLVLQEVFLEEDKGRCTGGGRRRRVFIVGDKEALADCPHRVRGSWLGGSGEGSEVCAEHPGRHAWMGWKRVFGRKGDIGLPMMGPLGMAKAAVWVGYWRPVASGQSKERRPRDWSNP